MNLSFPEAWSALLWHEPLRNLSPVKRALVCAARLLRRLIADLLGGEISLRAMGLVYTTLLALAPLLAVSFSALKAFGVQDQMEGFLNAILEPLGEQGPEITARIIDFVANIQAKVLGVMGLAMLFYVTVSVVHKIEMALNAIWRVRSRRSWLQRIGYSLSTVIVGPALMVSFMGAIAAMAATPWVKSMMGEHSMAMAVSVWSALAPTLLMALVFTLIYRMVPDAPTRFGPALLGGLLAGTAWRVVGWAFTRFVAQSTQYTAIYSAFATLILFMMWLYISWLVFLLGARAAYLCQNRGALNGDEGAQDGAYVLADRMLAILLRLGRDHAQGEAQWSADRLAHELDATPAQIEQALARLSQNGLIRPLSGDRPAYLPARPLQSIPAQQVIDLAMGGAPFEGTDAQESLSHPMRQALARGFDGMSVADLAKGDQAQETHAP
ncbi:YhjD/YihY/BrkB family envelope integrity protein [Magnetofaba australis]|uniref:Putative ribonuclease BN n=1 Tax=Magnetofaba australis IT-1 TaxID=1434232 RepID=A0A1Y2K202_9PROT|nr:YhjD/YihY/BrkB family envelope integrity protein [Magnetofaba australis]OSM01687.1 putative ribonuclease BN [Magnetofaba australis IT-1]